MPIGDIKNNRDYYYWLRHWAGYMSGKTVCNRIKLYETTGNEHYYDEFYAKGI